MRNTRLKRYLYGGAALVSLMAGGSLASLLIDLLSGVLRYREFKLRLAGFERRELKASYGGFFYYVNDSKGQKTPVMFLHGLGMSGEQWGNVMADMGGDRSLCAIEFLGFGRSLDLKVPDKEYGIGLFTRQVEDLRRELGWERMIVAGVSMGGWVAAQYALDHPDRVAGLLLLSAAGLEPVVPENDLRRTLEDFDFKTPEGFRNFVNTYMVYKPLYIPDFVGRAATRYIDRGGYRLFLKNVGRQTWLADRVSDLEEPTALVWGRQDALFPFDAAMYLQEHIPHARLFPVDKAGHAFLFTQPDRARSVMREAFGFIDQSLQQK